ncbi:MAG: SDR family NAD(P)-dependent oxidoreductase, partial [Pseudomonadota bacterium]
MTDWMKPGNTAVVTGAAGGIGLEAARRYAAAGMNIVVADVKEELGVAEEELAAITSSPDKVLAKSCDVSKLEEVEALRDAALDRFGKVHCLMNNAGIGRPGSLPWEDLEQLHTILGVNLMGVVHGCHAF